MSVVGLKAEVYELKMKVVKGKKVDIAGFKESDAYDLALNTATTQILAKERLEMK